MFRTKRCKLLDWPVKLTNGWKNPYHNAHNCEILEYWHRGKALKALSRKKEQQITTKEMRIRVSPVFSLEKWGIPRENDFQDRVLYPANLTINIREQ